MNNSTHSLAQNLGSLGWNFSFIGDIKVVTDSDGNAIVLNSGIESVLPSQLPGTALYDTANPESPIDELVSSPYRLNSQQLLQPSSSGSQFFKKKPCGSYQDADGSLTWNVDHYQLEKSDGTVIVFRPDGQLNYVEDSNGYRLTAGYTGDVLTEISASNGDSFTLVYNLSGRIETVTDNNGQINSYNYDPTGQYLLSVEDVNGTTSFSYDNPFDPTVVSSVTYGDGSKVSYDYDHAGRLQQVIYGEGREALAYTYSYDDNGGVTVSDPSGATTQQLRNEQGQVSQTIDALGRTTNYSYDEAGNLVGIDGELEYSAGFTYDSNGNVTSQTNALNQTTYYTYQADSNRLSGFKDARGNDVLYSYDSAGNLSQITYEDGTTDKYVYNADGLLTKSINRRGQEIAYEYNDNYQITKETHSDGRLVEYGYSSNNDLVNYIVDSNTEDNTHVQYDRANNRLSFNNSNGLVGIYTFDELGRKIQITIQDGTNTHTTNYSYDSLGRLDRLTDSDGNLIVDYDYHSISGQLTKETNGNGTYTSYSYDLAGQLVSLVNSQADGTINSRFDYTYDNLGRRTEVATLDGTWSYEYDLSGQLTGAVFASTNPDIESQDLTYVYNAAGNRTQTIVNGVTENYSTNKLNQYQSAGTTTYSYDLDGNLTSKTEGGQTWTYSYNDDNHLVSVVDSDNNLTQYEYDAFGNRTATVYNGQRTEYLIDPFGYGDVIAEYDGDGNLIAKYEHGIGLVSRTDAGNNQSFYDFDGTGSTAALTGIAGTEVNSYAYRPFGEDFYEVETVDNSFEYIGQWGITEEANGLDFMRARYYDSHSGRFVASDPIGLQGNDSNFYRYVGNNPVNFIDPEGTDAVSLSLAAIFGVGAVGGFFSSKAVGAGVIQGYGASFLAAGAAISKLPGGAITSLPFILFGSGLVLGATAAKLNSPTGIGLIPSVHAAEANGGFEAAEAQIWRPACPLILDLDGDGIELTSLENSDVYFDVDGDGFREKTGWLKSDDGLLVFDRNKDGYINDISELFGNQTTGGFTELRELDSNNDGQITAADTNFADLQVWRDFDEDGRSDVNELFTLDELNITKIDAIGNSVNITNEGHRIDETGSFELANGTQREVANVWFNLDQLDSYYDHNSTFNSPLVITEQILNLPNLRGYGNLPDLRIAMAKDPELLTLVESFTDNVNSGDVSAARELMRPILFRWAGVDDVDPIDNYPNTDIDIQELRFLETFVGRSWNNSNPNFTGGQTLSNTYQRLQGDLEARLLVQLTESPVTYNTTLETYEFSGTLNEAVAQFEAIIVDSQDSASETIDLQAFALAQYIQQESVEKADWILGDVLDETLTGTASDDQLFGMLGNDSLAGGEGNDIYYGGLGNDTLSEYSQSYGVDTLDGGTGDDLLYGAGNNDIYIFDKGYGSDTISDFVMIPQYARPPKVGSGGEADTIIFGTGITRDNLTWNFNGVNLTFSLTDSPEDSLTIVNYVNSIYRIENIEVEGNFLTKEEIIGLQTWQDTSEANTLSWSETPISFQGLAGDDNITTGDYNDTVWGNEGNDRLNTGNGDDTLHGGEGNDTLNAGNGNNYLVASNGNDSLVSGSGEDTLYGQVGDDVLQGGDGNDIYYGGAGNDNLSEYSRSYGVDTLDGGTGDDFLSGAGNNDIYIFNQGYGSDTISDFVMIPRYARPAKLGSGGESDTVIFGTGITRDNLTWNFNGKDLTFTLTNSPNDTLTIENYHNSFYRIENIQVEGSALTPEEIIGSQTWQDTSETDSLSWLDTSISYKGLAGNDTITTGNYDDKIWGDAGNDVITSGGGNDTVNGNAGNDVITSGGGNDAVNGNAGNDNLNAGDGDDTLDGGEGDDTLSAGNGNNYLEAGTGNDSLIAGSGLDTLDGGADNDTLNGGYGNDAYYGGDGNDFLSDSYNNNLSDSDTLDGGTGNDTLRGGGGNDTYIFDRGYGQDLISDYGTYKSYHQAPRTTGGGASDTLIFGNGITRDNLRWDFDGKDLVFTLANSIVDSLTINNYYNSFYRIENFEVEGNALTLDEIIGSQTWQDTSETNTLTWLDSSLNYRGLAGNDTITTGDYDDKIWGDAGDDSITSGGGNDTLFGNDGNDNFNAGEGDDTLYGGSGDDTLGSGNGNNYLEAGTGNDSLIAGSGLDTLDGGADNDTLNGGYGNDAYYGGDGNDFLSDSYNNNLSDSDTLDGGTGNDTLRGGGGNDTYIFDRGYGQDLISDYGTYKSYHQAPRTTGGGASDTLIFGSGITRDNLRWNFDGLDLSFTLTDSPGDRLTVKNYYNSIYRIENIEVEGSQLTKEEIIGLQTWQDTSEVNILDWSETAISFKGLAGNDTITTGEYDDKIWGGAGNDQLNSGFGNDTLYGGLGDDTLKGGEGIDWLLEFGDVDYVLTDNSLTGRGNDSFSQIELVRLQGGAGDNLIDASAVTQLNVTLDGATAGGNDTLIGGTLNDFLMGRDGNDSLLGNSGNDSLYGGDGDDTLRSNSGNDLINAGNGDDSLYGSYGNDSLYGGAGTDRILEFGDVDYTLTNTQLTGVGTDTISQIELARLQGGAGDNLIDASSATGIKVTLDGREGDDTLIGGTLNDFLMGRDGNDSLLGNSGNDSLYGSDGDDTLRSNSGNDLINAGNGDDSLYGSYGNDSLYGGAGTDRILEFGDVDYTLTNTQLTGVGTDTISQIELARLQGGAGDNLIDASAVTQLNVTLDGAIAGGDDTLMGGAKDDFLMGRNGDDRLEGGDGNDSLYGHEGNDSLYGGTGDDFLNAGNGNDTLYGGVGNDTLFGSKGNDVFVLEPGAGEDVITDFDQNFDLFGLTISIGFSDLSIINNNAGTAALIRDTTNNNRLLATVNNLSASDITVDDFMTI